MKKKRFGKHPPFFNYTLKFLLILLAFLCFKNTIFSQISKLPNQKNQTDAPNFCLSQIIPGEFIQILASDNDKSYMKITQSKKTNNNVTVKSNSPAEINYLLIQNSKNKLEYYSLPDRSKLWELELEDKISNSYVTDGNILIILIKNTHLDSLPQIENIATIQSSADEQKSVYLIRSINLETGLPLRTAKISLPPDFDLKIGEEKIYFYRKQEILDIYLIGAEVLNVTDLEIEQIKKAVVSEFFENTADPNSDQKLRLTNGDAIITGDQNGSIIAGNRTGKVTWSIRIGGAVTDLAASGKILYISSKDNFIYALAAKSGKIKWKYRLEDRANHQIILLENSLLIFQTGNSAVLILDKENGRLQNRIRLPERTSLNAQPVNRRGIIYLPTNTGIYRLAACPNV